MLYVGLDVHAKQSSLEILDPSGRRVKRLEVRGGWSKVVEHLAGLTEPFSVCYEASCGYGHLYDRLRPLASHVAVAHPGKLRLIWRSKRKNDRFDAAKLAKLLLLEMVPQVHVPPVNVRQWRGLIQWRQRLLSKRVSCKNQVRAVFRGLGITTPAAKALWTGKGLAWLREQSASLSPLDALKVEMTLDELERLSAHVKTVEKELAKIAAQVPGVALLRTIPGVGIRTAEAFCAYVDEIARFRHTRQLGTYFGLVPCQDASADRNRLGHITREGPAVMRKLLCEAGWMAVRRCAAMKGCFERIMRNDPQRKKIALIATAHRLCRVMGAMLRSGEAYDPGRLRGGGGGRKNPIRPQAVLPAPAPPSLSGFPSSLGVGPAGPQEVPVN